MSQSSGTLTIGDIDGNDDISSVELKAMGGNGRFVVGDSEIFMYGNQNSNAEFKFTSNIKNINKKNSGYTGVCKNEK